MIKDDIEEQLKRRVFIKDKKTGKFIDTCMLLKYSAFRSGNREYLRISIIHHEGDAHNYDIEASQIIDVVDNYLKPWLKDKKRD